MLKKEKVKELKIQRSSGRLEFLTPKANVYTKVATQREYIRRPVMSLVRRKSPKTRVGSKKVFKSRLLVVGSKEKIEKMRPKVRTPVVINSRRYLSRPCTCSSTNNLRSSRETLTIKIPNKVQDIDSDTDSNPYMESKLNYNACPDYLKIFCRK